MQRPTTEIFDRRRRSVPARENGRRPDRTKPLFHIDIVILAAAAGGAPFAAESQQRSRMARNQFLDRERLGRVFDAV